MDPNNPYATPAADLAGDGNSAQAKGSPRAIVWGWEKLRIKYNLILALPGIAILFFYMYKGELPIVGAFVSGLFMAIGANACFLLGPLSESYAAAFFDKAELPTYRKVAFWAGVIGSLALFGFALLPLIFLYSIN
ncbi:MAG: hypothetical protein ACPG32_12625 [Akkermansiaceae bacterium]